MAAVFVIGHLGLECLGAAVAVAVVDGGQEVVPIVWPGTVQSQCCLHCLPDHLGLVCLCRAPAWHKGGSAVLFLCPLV